MNIKEAILRLPQRADKNDDNTLAATFVEVGALMPLLLSINNHILFGRRGTGKTHVLKYLKTKVEENNDIGIYIDMRLIGSSRSIYSDSTIPLPQRTLRLLSDVIKEVHDGILNYLSSPRNVNVELSNVAPLLNQLSIYAEAEVVNGSSMIRNTQVLGRESGSQLAAAISANPIVAVRSQTATSQKQEFVESVSGQREAYLDYQSIFAILKNITEVIAPSKLWILVDEFSEVAPELQVYLADMFKRVFSPNNNVVYKIAAIEHRSSLIKHMEDGGYLGLEVGADIASCNLDNYLVFGNNEAQASMFYRSLLLGHVNSMLGEKEQVQTSDELIRELFTQENAFLELVAAAEGVPRDAFNILSKAITIDYYNKISIPTLRKAARQWYIQDKQKNVEAYEGAFKFLSWIIDVVINNRHAKAFLLKSGSQVDLIKYLFDARILHIIKQSISGRDIPGERYDVYSIDYGCYCDLINTARQPKGLFEVSDDEDVDVFVDVPKDDYRSIRRAILDLSDCPFINGANSLH